MAPCKKCFNINGDKSQAPTVANTRCVECHPPAKFDEAQGSCRVEEHKPDEPKGDDKQYRFVECPATMTAGGCQICAQGITWQMPGGTTATTSAPPNTANTAATTSAAPNTANTAAGSTAPATAAPAVQPFPVYSTEMSCAVCKKGFVKTSKGMCVDTNNGP